MQFLLLIRKVIGSEQIEQQAPTDNSNDAKITVAV